MTKEIKIIFVYQSENFISISISSLYTLGERISMIDELLFSNRYILRRYVQSF